MTINRKELTRQYKETPRTAGVAVVRCAANGKALVIAGNDIPALINRHTAQLKMSAHPNAALQRDWNALGADQFSFEIADTLTRPENDPGADITDDLRALEALWMEQLKPYEPTGYHRVPKAKV